MVLSTRVALGFCGFYVAKADTQLFNKASKVALARHDGKTAIDIAKLTGDAELLNALDPRSGGS